MAGQADQAGQTGQTGQTGQSGNGRLGRGLRVPPAVMRQGARMLGRRCLDPALPWPTQRTRLARLTRPLMLPRGISVTEQSIGGVPVEVVSAQPSRRTVVHFHGGGYCVGSPLTIRGWAAHLSAQAGCRVVLPDYRLAPEHPYPAALQDARAIVTTLAAEAGPGSVVLSGDSAGGGLALALLLALRDEERELPAGCILLSPWLDLGRDRRAVPELVSRDVLLSPTGWTPPTARSRRPPGSSARSRRGRTGNRPPSGSPAGN